MTNVASLVIPAIIDTALLTNTKNYVIDDIKDLEHRGLGWVWFQNIQGLLKEIRTKFCHPNYCRYCFLTSMWSHWIDDVIRLGYRGLGQVRVQKIQGLLI